MQLEILCVAKFEIMLILDVRLLAHMQLERDLLEITVHIGIVFGITPPLRAFN